MRFKTNDRLIELLVGDKLYSSADAAIRELLQNAEDACSLRLIAEPTYVPAIRIEFSVQNNWLSVSDNGIGMDLDTFEASFADIGARKDEIPHIRALLEKADHRSQIAYFGIGILSCFGVTESLEIQSKMQGRDGISFRINGFKSDFEDLATGPSNLGTTVKLQLKPDGPMTAAQLPDAVSRFARHASHIVLYDVDNSSEVEISETWNDTPRNEATRLNDPAVRQGYLGLDEGWNNINAPLQTEMVICNGGFLVTVNEVGILPPQAFGFKGEIDIDPGHLSVLMNREGFQRDSKWSELSARLTDHYLNLVQIRLQDWKTASSDIVTNDAVARALIVITRGSARSIMPNNLLTLAEELLPHTIRIDIWNSQTRKSVSDIVNKSGGVVYFLKAEEIGRQVQEALPYGSGTLQLTEQVSTESIRAKHLQLRGHTVVSCKDRNYTIQQGGKQTRIRVHEEQLLSTECQARGVELIRVSDVPDSEVGFSTSETSRFLSEILGLGEGIKLVNVEGQDPIIRDFTGRLVNFSHPEVKEVLRYLPDAVGSPVRRELLQAWMEIKTFRSSAAEIRLKKLLTDPELPSKLSQRTGKFTRNHVSALLEDLLAEEDQ